MEDKEGIYSEGKRCKERKKVNKDSRSYMKERERLGMKICQESGSERRKTSKERER